jgi:hypothetical protein
MFLQGICRWSGYAGADASTYIPWTFFAGAVDGRARFCHQRRVEEAAQKHRLAAEGPSKMKLVLLDFL